MDVGVCCSRPDGFQDFGKLSGCDTLCCGANYVSGSVDVGQYGVPAPNPCNDPYNPATGLKEGGALRARDARTTGDPLSFSGAVLRVNPANPADRRIVAHGFRNPFRFGFRPGTNELWQGSVG